MSQPTEMTCAQCRARRDPRDSAALAWTCDQDGDTTSWLCPACTRRHVRDIEARLTREWW